MGSGCSSNCQGCNNFFVTASPDTGIEYTGPTIPTLGICTHDRLSEVEAVILSKLIDFSTGIGIHIPDIDLSACGLFSSYVTCCNGCDDLQCLMQIVFNSLCTLYGDVTTLQTQMTSLLNGPYNIACLQNLSSNPTLNQIIQELILEFCTLQSDVNTLKTQFASLSSNLNNSIGNFLNSSLSSCQGNAGLVKSGTGSSFLAALKGFTLVGVVLPYVGPTAGLFDSTGLGLANTPACGWAFANGNNGTTNFMGQVPRGSMAMGGSSPSNTSGLGIVPIGTYDGFANITLNTTQIPSVGVSGSITATVPDHNHGFFFRKGTGNLQQGGGPDNYIDPTGPLGANTQAPVGSGTQTPASVTAYNAMVHLPITVSTSSLSTSGGGLAHSNIQPSVTTYYIQRIS